ncbi:hypothetical protein SNE25_19695 [Mucilaginibacter sabulilitoris]|uniref:Uncharacterized protein n=1 Tax=Mucilaginibacter sabulilitoris TaxID=1173583 RepID=A0ABZ0TEB9_9SPHI|nr:hypothetical protein [Mucilaginibacter sabulilitoris]WPU91545.1 hypothetical protein SNE25_19695 [Mucilaginibacter sabulilitoris]
MGNHFTSTKILGRIRSGQDANVNLPFGDTILKISEIHHKITNLRQNDDESAEFNLELNKLEEYLHSAYQELADAASAKIADWKQGPIDKNLHLTEDKLCL